MVLPFRAQALIQLETWKQSSKLTQEALNEVRYHWIHITYHF
jgi:hypothetical protein